MVWLWPRRRRIEATLALVGMAAAVGLGAWWTAEAVVGGRPWAMAARFSLSVAAGVYYRYLYWLSRRAS